MSRGFIKIELLILIVILFVFSAVLTAAFFSARVEARDKIRIQDISQIQKSLDIYRQENGFYPPSVSAQPSGFDSYLEYWPQAPKADGRCNDAWNRYTYNQTLGGRDFELTFCLGKESGDISPGVHTLTSEGLE